MDVIVFLVWFALLLAPVFNEISLFGIKLKQEMDDLRRDLNQQVQSLKSEIQNVIQISPSITIPPADSQLPAIEQEVRRVLDDIVKRYGLSPTPDRLRTISEQLPGMSDDVQYLFRVRYTLERELRAIAKAALQDVDAKLSPSRVIDMLTKSEILDPELARAIRQVYAVCSPAIHGEDITAAQVSFVKDLAPQLYNAVLRLREIAEVRIAQMGHAQQSAAT